MNVEYINGDATRPKEPGTKIIVHVCNDIGKWGMGFVIALSRRWKKPEQEFLEASNRKDLRLGDVQLIKVESDIWVANMIAQRGIKVKKNLPPIRYDYLEKCLEYVALFGINSKDTSIHMPRIGCGLAGGKWNIVEAIIKRTLISKKIPVFVYDLKAVKTIERF